ncbi:hypothetical protein, partial [Paenibacillus xylanexedens]|uniref:hypothetical protein n=1 Tax=Paenibacillus xylanexedens TaxID=528191 RepID=UPI00119D331D
MKEGVGEYGEMEIVGYWVWSNGEVWWEVRKELMDERGVEGIIRVEECGWVGGEIGDYVGERICGRWMRWWLKKVR